MANLSEWVAQNYQFLTVLGALILTNLNYRVSFAVLEVKVGDLQDRQKKCEVEILELIKQRS
jgi:hypothetical protein